ncbi:MAG: hypothetical protein HY716_14720 [Planctomycetes bacterium]|nr:hypothetical protein [Planctomycetota bacterium]
MMADSNPPAPPPSEPPAPAPAEATPPKKKKSRLKRILLWSGASAGILLLFALFLGPPLIASVLRRQILEHAGRRLDAAVHIESVSFSWTGRVGLENLSLIDREGQPVLSARSIVARVSVFPLLSGRFIVELSVNEPSVVIRKEAGGALNLATLMKPAPPSAETAPPSAEKPATLPYLKASLRVTGGSLRIVGPGGETNWRDLRLSADIDSLDRPIAFEAAATSEHSGRIHADGRITVAKEGRLDLDGLHGAIRARVEELGLAGLTPAAALFAAVDRLQGRADMTIDATLESLRAFAAKGSLSLTDALAEGAVIGPEPLRLPSLRLSHDIGLDPQGTGTQHVTLEAGTFLRIQLQGESRNLFSAGSFEGAVQATADLRGLSDAGASLLRLKEGYRLDGRAVLDGPISFGTAGGARLSRAGADLKLSIADLTPVDARGQAIPLDDDGHLLFQLKSSYRAEPPSFLVDALKIQAGSLRVEGEGGLEGNILKSSRLAIEANLNRLAERLASFMELNGFTFGGTVRAEATAQGSDEQAAIRTSVEAQGLRFGQAGPIDIHLQQAGTLDSRPGGRSTLDTLAITSSPIEVRASGSVTDLLEPDRVKGSVDFSVMLNPVALSQTLGPWLGEISLAGSPIHSKGTVSVEGPRMSLGGRLDAPQLTVTAGKPVSIHNVTAEYKAAAEGDRFDARIDNFASDLVHGRLRAVRGSPIAIEGDFRGSLARAAAVARAFLPEVKDAAGEWSLGVQAKLEATGSMNLRTLTFKAPGCDLALSGSMKGTDDARFAMDAVLVPDELRNLYEIPVSGPRITARVEVSPSDMRGTLSAPELRIRDSQQRNVKVEFDVARAEQRFEVRSLTARSDTVRASAKGRIVEGETELTFDATGDVAPIAALAGLDGKGSFSARGSFKGSAGEAKVKLDGVAMTGLHASGTIEATFADGRARAAGTLAVNEGTVALNADADLREARNKPSSRAELKFEKVRANAAMGPLLSLLHPMFHVAGAAAGQIDGRVSLLAQLRYDGPLTSETLAGGWEQFSKNLIHGGGRFEIQDCVLKGSPLLGEILSQIGGAQREIRMRPVEWIIRQGRVSYVNPWPWTLAGAETSFSGSVGLDQTLDLSWRVPVTDELAERFRIPDQMKGKTLDVPIQGTATSPRLGWKDVIAKVVTEGARDALRDRARDALEGLFGRDERKAKKLLSEADELYAAGRKKEAAEKYRELNDKYERTNVYKEHRTRIRQRMNER